MRLTTTLEKAMTSYWLLNQGTSDSFWIQLTVKEESSQFIQVFQTRILNRMLEEILINDVNVPTKTTTPGVKSLSMNKLPFSSHPAEIFNKNIHTVNLFSRYSVCHNEGEVFITLPSPSLLLWPVVHLQSLNIRTHIIGNYMNLPSQLKPRLPQDPQSYFLLPLPCTVPDR